MPVAIAPFRLDCQSNRIDFFARHSREQKVLPYREPDIAVAEFAGEPGKLVHLRGGHLADRQHDPDPVAPFLLLRVNAYVCETIRRRRASHRPSRVRRVRARSWRSR